MTLNTEGWTVTGFCVLGEHPSCTHVINLGTGVRGIRLCRCWCHGPERTDGEWSRRAEQLLTGQEP